MATNQVVKTKQTMKDLLAQPSIRKRIDEVLGKKSTQFVLAVSQASRQQGLDKCDPMTVLTAAFTAASLDLPIDKNLGFAHLIPYKEGGIPKCQFQMGYKGIIQLALRTGQYSALNDCVINKEAFQSYNPITGDLKVDADKLEEAPDEKDVAGYAFHFRLINGFEKTVYWSREKIERHAKKYSQAYRAKKKDSPWFNNFDIMALKTVIMGTLRKYGILSVEMQTGMKYDQAIRTSLDDESDPLYIDNQNREDQPQESTPIDTSEFDRLVKEKMPVVDSTLDLFVQETAKANDVTPDQLKVEAAGAFDGFWASFEMWRKDRFPEQNMKEKQAETSTEAPALVKPKAGKKEVKKKSELSVDATTFLEDMEKENPGKFKKAVEQFGRPITTDEDVIDLNEIFCELRDAKI